MIDILDRLKNWPQFKCIFHSFELRVWAKVLMEVPVMKITNHFKTGWKKRELHADDEDDDQAFFWNTQKNSFR